MHLLAASPLALDAIRNHLRLGMSRHKSHEQLQAVRKKLRLERLSPLSRKVVVGIAGGLCVIAGAVMIFTPGPALVFIPLGTVLLATEFPWAERWFYRMKESMHKARARWRLRRRRRRRPGPVANYSRTVA